MKKMYGPILFVKLLLNFSFLNGKSALFFFFCFLVVFLLFSHRCFCDSVPCDEDKSNIASLLREVFVSSSCLILALNTNWKCNNPYIVKQSNTGCLLPRLSLFRFSPPPKKKVYKHSLFNTFIRYTLCMIMHFIILAHVLYSLFELFFVIIFVFVNKCFLKFWSYSVISVTEYAPR